MRSPASRYAAIRKLYPDVSGPGFRQLQERSDRLFEIVEEAKSKPCTDCGVEYPSYVMHFDHLDSANKKFNISEAATLLPSESVLLAELAKCELVCANCHAERTHQRAVHGGLVAKQRLQAWKEGKIDSPRAMPLAGTRAAAGLDRK